MTSTSIIIVPGWRDSGPGHWQTLWAERLPQARRVVQDDWHTPTRSAWVARLEETVLEQPGPVVIVAHSLGCITTAHMKPEAAARVRGALLVAPADPERRAVLSDFAPVPYAALPYRSILVASSNDPYCPIRLAGAYARAWGSEFVRLAERRAHQCGFRPWRMAAGPCAIAIADGGGVALAGDASRRAGAGCDDLMALLN